VWVNECGIFAHGPGADRWAMFWVRANPARIATLEASIGGGIHHVACASKEDAEQLRDSMVEMGIHPKFVKVQRLAAAKKAAEARRVKFAEAAARIAEMEIDWEAFRTEPEEIEP
jgi:hypothetical protein